MNNVEIASIPFFFIIGRPRSGTTLLETLFDAHPNVNIPAECTYIIDLYKHYEKIRLWDEKILMEFYEDLTAQRKFNAWIVDREKLKQDLLNCKGETTFQNICRVVHLNYQSLYEKKEIKLIGDKNPVYSIYVKQLMRLFPEAKFVYINRDYRDNIVSNIKVASIRKDAFAPPFVPILAHRWKRFYKIVEKQMKKFPKKILYLKYENLVNDPKKYTKEVCDFLGVEFIPEVLDFYKKKDEFNKHYGSKFDWLHGSLFKPISTVRVKMWEDKLTKSQVKMADMIVGKQLAEKLGYDLTYKKFDLFLYMRILPLIWYDKCLSFLGILVNMLPYRLMRRVKERDSILKKVFIKLFG